MNDNDVTETSFWQKQVSFIDFKDRQKGHETHMSYWFSVNNPYTLDFPHFSLPTRASNAPQRKHQSAPTKNSWAPKNTIPFAQNLTQLPLPPTKSPRPRTVGRHICARCQSGKDDFAGTCLQDGQLFLIEVKYHTALIPHHSPYHIYLALHLWKENLYRAFETSACPVVLFWMGRFFQHPFHHSSASEIASGSKARSISTSGWQSSSWWHNMTQKYTVYQFSAWIISNLHT